MKKVLCLILVLVIVCAPFAGCTAQKKPEDVKVTADGVLTYALDQQMIDRYYQLLTQSEELAIAAEDLEETDRVSDELEDAFMALSDQYQIAYVLYCLDQSDADMKKQYLDALDVATQAESDYNEMCKRVWLSETPFREHLFADWSQEEIDRMLLHNDEIAQLEKRNGELMVAFRDLPDETRDRDMIPLYNELVRNNNRIAQIYGYDNYYSYAYEVVYQRDYGVEEVEKLRNYTAEYLVDTHADAMDAFYDLYADMDKEESDFLETFLFEGYKECEEDYVDLYIRDMPQSPRENMQSMFQDKRVIFTEYKHAYPGAFTTWIGDLPYCYFGPDYDNCETVIHELGHYYGTKIAEDLGQPMDLAETHSQGNEWLFISFLAKKLTQDDYRRIAEYKLLNELGYIICFVIIDQFEQQVYTHKNAGNLTEAEYEEIMENVAQNYGGIEYINTSILDLQSYWRLVVLDSPVYYVSYAVSGMTAIGLFANAEEDPERARQCYIRLIEESAEDAGFLETIEQAELNSPFDEITYERICKRYKK